MQSVIGRITALIHVLIPGTCEYVSLHGRKGFAGVSTLKILKCRDHAGVSGWTQYDHKSPYKGKAGGVGGEVGE